MERFIDKIASKTMREYVNEQYKGGELNKLDLLSLLIQGIMDITVKVKVLKEIINKDGELSKGAIGNDIRTIINYESAMLKKFGEPISGGVVYVVKYSDGIYGGLFTNWMLALEFSKNRGRAFEIQKVKIFDEMSPSKTPMEDFEYPDTIMGMSCLNDGTITAVYFSGLDEPEITPPDTDESFYNRISVAKLHPFTEYSYIRDIKTGNIGVVRDKCANSSVTVASYNDVGVGVLYYDERTHRNYYHIIPSVYLESIEPRKYWDKVIQ